MGKPEKFTFSNGRTALAVRVQHVDELPTALLELGLHSGHPVLVVIGGASRMDVEELHRIRLLFVEGLIPAVIALGAVVIDGGTNAGVMQFMGQARSITGGAFPLIGVAATGTVVMPDEPDSPHQAAQLEPHHTHFVLVPGMHWGDESPWLSYVADMLSTHATSLTVLVNGGKISWEDVAQSVKAGRPVVVIKDSGRTADALVRALREGVVDERAKRLVASGLIRAVDITRDFDELTGLIVEMLSSKV